MLRLKLITITPDARAERQPAPVVNHLQHARRSGDGEELAYRIVSSRSCPAALQQFRVNTNILPKEGIKYVCTKINWGSGPCKQLIYYNEKQTLCLCSSGKTDIVSKQAAKGDIHDTRRTMTDDRVKSNERWEKCSTR